MRRRTDAGCFGEPFGHRCTADVVLATEFMSKLLADQLTRQRCGTRTGTAIGDLHRFFDVHGCAIAVDANPHRIAAVPFIVAE